MCVYVVCTVYEISEITRNSSAESKTNESVDCDIGNESWNILGVEIIFSFKEKQKRTLKTKVGRRKSS